MSKQTFNIGDTIQHDTMGTRATVLSVDERGYMVCDETNGKWLLQTNWTAHWRIV